MRDLELHAIHLKDEAWLVQFYDPNIATIEQEIEKEFNTVGEVTVWAESFGKVENVWQGGDSVQVSVPYENKGQARKMLAL